MADLPVPIATIFAVIFTILYLLILMVVIIIVVILALNHIFGWSKYLSDSENLKFLSSMIHEHFAMAALIYIGLTIVSCVVLALPGVTFAILAGAIFGPWWGTLFCLIATTLGAIIAFIVGRFFLKDSIKPMVEKNALLKKILFDDAGRSDIVLLAITRLVPLFPYNIQNFALLDLHLRIHDTGRGALHYRYRRIYIT